MPQDFESHFGRFERYTVGLTGTHWGSLTTEAHLKAWVEARQMGLSVAQCDRIADAALVGVRGLIEQWAQGQAAPDYVAPA